MLLSMDKIELMKYTSCQLNYLFPDKNKVNLFSYSNLVDLALDRLNYCFKQVSIQHYNNGETAQLNHLYSDHYLMYIWFLANTIWKDGNNSLLASKLYYLNKALHGIDCMYDTKLPDIFLLFHSSGTVLGKATYSNYFVALQGCTVGSHKGKYPVLGIGVSLTANSSVIGHSTIGNRCTISTRVTLFEKDVSDDQTVFINIKTNQLQTKPTKKCYAQQFFKTDLRSII